MPRVRNFFRQRTLPLLMVSIFLTACTVTPVYMAELGTREFARHEDLKGKLSNAIIDEEGDMLTLSVRAVAEGRTQEAEQFYLQGYQNPNFGPEIKAIALHQIAMIYKSSYNADRDYQKAINYLNRIVNEFPQSRGAEYAQVQIAKIKTLQANPISLTPAEKLAEWELTAVNLQSKYDQLDQDMNPLSRRAVVKNRTAEALELYTLVYNESGMPADFRAAALYQKALILVNREESGPNDRHVALLTLRQIISEFPKTRYRKGVERHINDLLNRDRETLKSSQQG
ncbi:tetratricopeptide repeat protein [Parendozoicomonas haliclonae]|uniref:Outer membrane protein assembly factor BamD n=1 Tax=Parendozoicomonas haliclonae TaxID=1960125 RepID=A0A1X7AI54_9GAMM|nr:tetratricopeptide repeat protein [Parendozoicomonas haliclonae]SMA42472.1 Outer membrane protein assembly factor BamD [Parendozoicomonas haliclonae]